MNITKRIGSRFLSGVSAIAFAATANMLSAGAVQAEEEDTFGIEEIIITATKRSMSLQDVPLSITALTGQTLEDIGVDEFTDWARSVPSLSFVDRGPGRSEITLRGMASLSGRQSPVGLYIDGVPVSRSSNNPDLMLFDVDRIEVLRGPQGTLYGEGSQAGTIRILSKRPTNDFEIKGDLSASSTENGGRNYVFNAAVNVPIVEDQAGLRVVAFYRDRDGFIDNVGTGKDNVNDEQTIGVRAILEVKPSEDLTITGILNYQDMEVGGQPFQSNEPGFGDFERATNFEEPQDNEFIQASLEIQYDMGFAELTSDTGYFSGDDTILLDGATFGVPLSFPFLVDFTSDISIFTEEVRLVSTTDDPLKWVFGVFYSDREDSNVIDFFGLTGSIFDEQKFAVFGEVSYDLTEQFTVTVGARQMWEKASNPSLLDSGGGVMVVDPTTVGDETFNPFTPKIAFSYKVNEDAMIFASAAKGVRAGGLNTLPGTPAENSAYDPERAWTYELGAKTSWADNTVQVNVTAFYTDWQNLQINGTVDNPILGWITNGGEANIKGIELEIAASPADGLDLNFGLGYNDTELEVIDPGNRIPNVPKVTWNVGASYTAAVTENIDGFIRASFQNTGKSFGDTTNTVDRISAAYGLGNLRVGVTNQESWELSLFVDNFTNKTAALQTQGAIISRNRPRTIGFNLKLW